MFGVELALVGFVQALEFGFHELHVVLLGDHAIFVGVHEEEELFDVFLAESEAVLGLGDGCFLSGGSAEKSDGGKKDGDDDKELHAVGWIEHDRVLQYWDRWEAVLALPNEVNVHLEEGMTVTQKMHWEYWIFGGRGEGVKSFTTEDTESTEFGKRRERITAEGTEGSGGNGELVGERRG